jgi:hypothetical protein
MEEKNKDWRMTERMMLGISREKERRKVRRRE